MWRARGDATFAKSHALENKLMSDMNQDPAEISAPTPPVSFDSFDLPELMLATLAREGLVAPTPIQAMSIPLLLEGRDLIGLAQTGTGKTAAFLLPLMTHLGYSAAVRAGQPPKALILAPTRELANQIEQNVSKLSADLNIRHLAVFGGARYDAQIRGLRRGVDIVVATPGRLEDLMDRGAFDPSGITHFVLDEADHMLDLGFYPPIKRIAASLPRTRQTMLFSATMPPEIETLAKQFLTDPAHVKAPQTGITADKVTQRVTLMSEGDKRDRLCDILNEHDTGQSLIFVRTKRRADALAKFMEVRGFAVDALHGDMRQTLRQKVLRNFRSGQLRALIATDVAARGIDVAGLSHVINFDLTDTPEAYVHRIGRTGRAGLGGLALSFCAPDERNKLAAIIAAVGARVELYELDGTAVTDFKASGGAARGRRRPPQGARSRSQGDRSQGARRDDRRDDRPRRDDRRDDRPRRDDRRDDPPRGDASDRRQDGRPSAGRPSAGRPSANSARTSKPFDGERRQSRPFAKWADADNRPQRDTSERRDNRPRRDASDRRDDRRDDWSKRDGFQKRDGFEKRDSRFKGRDDASGRDRPASGDQKPGRNTKPSFGEKPARGKKPFGSKPAFNKRPNFGDKSAAQKPASDRGKPADRAASPAPKSRKVGPPRRGKSATPQGGQGTLKRRR
ncbi:MAG: DEAD/DEAH box helicase [Alphaproteobacteria bacterium]|nr:DEAD/DEAH box helicase [Alphaproteobacteria bacterium]